MADDAPDQVPDSPDQTTPDAAPAPTPAGQPAQAPPPPQAFLVPWRHGLSFGRDDAGNVVVQKRAFAPGEIVVGTDGRLAGEPPIEFEFHILPDEFAHLIAQLGDLGPAAKEPGADHTIRPVAAGYQ